MTRSYQRNHDSGNFTDVLARLVTVWDRRALARAAAMAVMAFVIAWVLTAATDEGNVPWGVRAGRALPLAPACAAVGTWLALAPARARGEDRALAALGRSPWERAVSAIAGGAVVALGAAVAIALVARVEISGFYPRIVRDLEFRYEAGAFVSDAGIRVEHDGRPTRAGDAVLAPRARETPLPAHARAGASLMTAIAGLALPLLGAQIRRRTLAVDLLALALVAATTIALLQAAATAKVGVFVASAPSFVLLGFVASRYRAWRWRMARSQR